VTNIYGEYAAGYLAKGYSPLPLPPRKKKSPPDGYTGKDAVMATGPDVFAWIDAFPTANIALRLPKGVVGIDVDNYGGKQGKLTMTEAIKLWGKLPMIGRLTSRYNEDELRVSGIRFFRIPDDVVFYDTLAAAGIGPDVDILQHHHRYALAPGSIHPDTDMPYEWIEADGSTIGELPAVADLPELPEAWVEGLRKKIRETPTEDVPHAAYDAMDAAEKKRSDAYVERALKGIREQFLELKALPKDARTAEGHGWETGSLSVTASLGSLMKADWNKLTLQDAWAAVADVVPSGPGFPVTNPKSKLARTLREDSDVKARPYPFTDDEIDLFGGVENRSRSGKADGGADGEGVTWEAKLVGGVQGHILFDTDGCRRIQVDDSGNEKEKEILPATTARRMIQSWPIAKQPLSKSQNWWVYKDGTWVLNDSIVRLSMAASFADSYKTADVAPVEDILSTMADEIEVTPHSDFINMKNGMLEWRTGELHEHSPSYYSTVQIPHDWNASATCEQFDGWLSERLPIAGVKLAWQLIAATLYSGIVSQRAGLLYGVGKSGKSTFLEVIQGLVGPSNASALSPQAMTKTVFATHALLGKQANIVTDIDPTRITETAIFKQVVAGEPIQAQQKNKPEFTFRPFCNHLFSANQIPRSSDRTSAWTRRFAILRFQDVIGDSIQIVDRYDKILLREAEGIIAKALTFLPELIAEGYSLVEADQEEFEEATDFTKQFWDDVVTITGNPLDFAATTHLAQAFDMWCQTNRIRNSPPFADVELRLRDEPIVEKTRKRLLAGRGNNPVRGWKGVSINPEYRPEISDLGDLFEGVPHKDD